MTVNFEKKFERDAGDAVVGLQCVARKCMLGKCLYPVFDESFVRIRSYGGISEADFERFLQVLRRVCEMRRDLCDFPGMGSVGNPDEDLSHGALGEAGEGGRDLVKRKDVIDEGT